LPELNSVTSSGQAENAAVHVKVNTDLNRLGFEPHELTDAVEEFLRLPELSIAGIFSHLASAEELNAGYTMHQLGTFERALAGVKPLLQRREMNALSHIAASAAALLWPQTRLDLARFGIALYGLMPRRKRAKRQGRRSICVPRSRIARRSSWCARLPPARRSVTAEASRPARYARRRRPAGYDGFRARSPIMAPSSSTVRSVRSSGASR
jgi:alanine racemase